MLGVGDQIPMFSVQAAKPGFNEHEEKGESAFETLTQSSFPGQWKLIYFYPKDFTFVCPTEISEYARLAPQFAMRNCVVMGGSTDNEFCKLAWRRAHPDLANLNHYSFGDPNGEMVEGFGVRDPNEGVALRATFLIDAQGNVAQVWRKVKVPGHAEAVLDAVRAL